MIPLSGVFFGTCPRCWRGKLFCSVPSCPPPLPSNIAYLCRFGRVFFAPQVDFNSFSWHTLFLLGGGNVLGKAIASSQLLEYLAHCIVPLLPEVCAQFIYRRPPSPPRPTFCRTRALQVWLAVL